MKIFIGLVEIAGYYSKLREGFRQIQIECTFVERAYNPFNFNSEKNFFSNAFQYIEKKPVSYTHLTLPTTFLV